jgi:hypothetical protein
MEEWQSLARTGGAWWEADDKGNSRVFPRFLDREGTPSLI